MLNNEQLGTVKAYIENKVSRGVNYWAFLMSNGIIAVVPASWVLDQLYRADEWLEVHDGIHLAKLNRSRGKAQRFTCSMCDKAIARIPCKGTHWKDVEETVKEYYEGRRNNNVNGYWDVKTETSNGFTLKIECKGERGWMDGSHTNDKER